MGGLRHSAGLLGMLQGFYGVGSSVAPVIANGMIRAGIPWYQFYYVPVSELQRDRRAPTEERLKLKTKSLRFQC